MKNNIRLNHPSDEIVAEIAWLYYVKGLTQGEIAKSKSLSRPTIITYIKLAKERGIVGVRISPGHLRVNELAARLTDRFGLKQVHVVPGEELAPKEVTRAVSEVAAHLLPNFLEPGDTLGVSWGETISLLAEMVPHWPIENLTVRQLIGSMANPLMITAENCTTEIARKLAAHCINMNAPAVCSNKKLAQALRGEPIIKEQLEKLKTCNKAIYSLSPCTPDTHVVHFKVATLKDVEEYSNRGAVCCLVGRFINIEGRQVSGDLDQRLFSVEIDDLKNMEGMLVVSGVHKTEATLGALRGGYPSRLVIDADLAECILST